MAKLKQNISGCFRAPDGGDFFARIRGYVSTLHKGEEIVFSPVLLPGKPRTGIVCIPHAPIQVSTILLGSEAMGMGTLSESRPFFFSAAVCGIERAKAI